MGRRKRRRGNTYKPPSGFTSLAKVYGRLGAMASKLEEPDDSFKVESDDVIACSRAPLGEVHIEADMWYRLVSLCQHFDHEWMGFLTGQVESDVVVVDGIYFPPQEVGMASVVAVEEAPEYAIKPNTVGAIHSHVKMSAKFSTTDEDHANWPLEIVINSKAEYEATLRLTVPCGFHMRGRARVHLSTDTEIEGMIDHIKEGIKLGLRARPPRPQPSIQHVGRYGWGRPDLYTDSPSNAEAWKKAMDKYEGL